MTDFELLLGRVMVTFGFVALVFLFQTIRLAITNDTSLLGLFRRNR